MDLAKDLYEKTLQDFESYVSVSVLLFLDAITDHREVVEFPLDLFSELNHARGFTKVVEQITELLRCNGQLSKDSHPILYTMVSQSRSRFRNSTAHSFGDETSVAGYLAAKMIVMSDLSHLFSQIYR
jgi:hypothetical protein